MPLEPQPAETTGATDGGLASRQSGGAGVTVARPLMVFDGDCGFCRRWIVRWQEITGDRADYEPAQEVGAKFPAIPAEDYAQEVKLIEPDGRVSGGAEAVFRLLAIAGGRWWTNVPLWAYRKVPGALAVTEGGYRLVASHRTLASWLTGLLWGNDVRAPTYQTARVWFLRTLAVVYLIAFGSLRLQIDGLVGHDGILPFAPLLDTVRTHYPFLQALRFLPTLCWVTGGGDAALHLLCNSGTVCSLLLLVGVTPALCLTVLWALYLSLAVAGQVFLEFQWDALLLETGFLAIFLAPRRWWMGGGARPPPPVSRTAVFLMRWLLFRFMLMSGVVKLTSGDDSWLGFTALRYHYQTQPLPTWIGWWMHQAPGWWQVVSLLFVFCAELVAPFFVFGPRRVRLAGFIILVLLQVLIALTGNYGFFNLLSVALCLPLLDDRQWPRGLAVKATIPQAGAPTRARGGWPFFVVAPVAAVQLLFGSLLLRNSFSPGARWPGPLRELYGWIAPSRSLNGYGLFRVMTRDRLEILVEGSDDGENWRPYTFRWKPGDPRHAPAFVAPYMPRLDWQMWFAALERYDDDSWFEAFLGRLLSGSPTVLGLLADNPFPDHPPRLVRARLFDYRFTDPATLRRTGEWWRSQPRGYYCPPMGLRQPGGG